MFILKRKVGRKYEKLTRLSEGEKGERHRLYLREYYQLHKERAREYQRNYNLTRKKKQSSGDGRHTRGRVEWRHIPNVAFTRNDLQHLPVGSKFESAVNQVLGGERIFVL